jgi:hypothetical protein
VSQAVWNTVAGVRRIRLLWSEIKAEGFGVQSVACPFLLTLERQSNALDISVCRVSL